MSDSTIRALVPELEAHSPPISIARADALARQYAALGIDLARVRKDPREALALVRMIAAEAAVDLGAPGIQRILALRILLDSIPAEERKAEANDGPRMPDPRPTPEALFGPSRREKEEARLAASSRIDAGQGALGEEQRLNSESSGSASGR